MFRMVIIGTAHMHCNEIALYISEHPEAELVAVADLHAAVPEDTSMRYTRAWNLRNIESNYGAAVYDDYCSMLDETKPDFAFILCENDRKREAAFECINRKIPFSLEKPMALNDTEAEEITAAARAASVEAFVNWPVIWRGYVNQMLSLAAQRFCGNPLKLEYVNGHTGPLGKGAKHRGVSDAAEEMSDESRAKTWWYQNEHGGGVYLDILCYGALYATWFLGKEWESVTAIGMNLATPYSDCMDNAAALIRYNSQYASISGTWTTPNAYVPTGPALFCTDGILYCSRDESGVSCVKAMDIMGKPMEIPSYEHPFYLKNMVYNYIHHKTTGAPMHAPTELSMNLDITHLLSCAISSAGTHAEVSNSRQ